MKISILTLLSMGLAFSSIVVGVILWKKLPNELRILTLYLVVGFVIGIVGVILASQGMNNLWLMHLYTPIQFSFLMLVFYFWSDGAVKRLVLFSIPAFIGFWTVMFIFFENFTQFNTFTKPTGALLLIIASGYVLYTATKEEEESFYRSPRFWIASGTLIYFSGMIFLYALFNQLLVLSAENLNLTWMLTQPIVSVLSYLMYIMGFLCKSPRLPLQQ